MCLKKSAPRMSTPRVSITERSALLGPAASNSASPILAIRYLTDSFKHALIWIEFLTVIGAVSTNLWHCNF